MSQVFYLLVAWGLSIKSTQGVGIYEAGKVFPKNNTRKLLQVVPNCEKCLLVMFFGQREEF